MSQSRNETLLNAMLNDEQVDITPRTRTEAYLKNCVDGCGCDGLPAPVSRADTLLYELADKLAGQSGGGGGGLGMNASFGGVVPIPVCNVNVETFVFTGGVAFASAT